MTQSIQNVVQSKYGAVANSSLSNSHDGVRAVAEAFGYTNDELASIPPDANMGLSCGNPTAFASLRPGEVVLDLGCGGGLDVFGMLRTAHDSIDHIFQLLWWEFVRRKWL